MRGPTAEATPPPVMPDKPTSSSGSNSSSSAAVNGRPSKVTGSPRTPELIRDMAMAFGLAAATRASTPCLSSPAHNSAAQTRPRSSVRRPQLRFQPDLGCLVKDLGDNPVPRRGGSIASTIRAEGNRFGVFENEQVGKLIGVKQ